MTAYAPAMTWMTACRQLGLWLTGSDVQLRADPDIDPRHGIGTDIGAMDADSDIPSLMDDVDFVAALEKMERAADKKPAARMVRETPSAPRYAPTAQASPHAWSLSVDEADVAEIVAAPMRTETIRPDLGGFQLSATPEMAMAFDMQRSLLPAFLTILIGLSAGAAGSALIFRDRITWLIDLWSR